MKKYIKLNSKTVFPVFAILVLSLLSFNDSNESNSRNSIGSDILWSPDRQLKWSDFQGPQDNSSPYKAVTTSRMKTKSIQYSKELVEYELYALFVKGKSWTKSNSLELLAHEQLHFDISELAMRRMRQKFSKHKIVTLEGVNKMLHSTFQAASKERKRLNREYDEETNHGLNKENQLAWEKRIKKELELLNDYSSIRVSITK